MVSCCNRRLYKGNSYEICLPITDTGVTSVRFYTSVDMVIEKEGEIVDDMMCFELTKEELDLLPEGVLRYSYDGFGFDSNTEYVIATPGDYSGTTLDDLLEDAFDSGYTAGQEDCSGDTCEGVFESGYTSGHTDGIAEQKAKMTELDVDNGDLEMSPGGVLEKDFYNTDGWNHVWVAVDTIDWWNSGYTSGVTEQKAKLVPTAITQNGTYSREDGGFSQVEVNVPTGQTINNQNKSAYIDNNQVELVYTSKTDSYNYQLIGNYLDYTYNSGYTGLNRLRLHVDINASEAIELGYDSGYTSGYTDGVNSVVCSGYTQEDLDAAFESGYTAGQDNCSGATPEELHEAYTSGFTLGRDTCNFIEAVYDVKSTTEPTVVPGVGNARFKRGILSDGTVMNPVSYNSRMGYVFPSSGLQTVYYELGSYWTDWSQAFMECEDLVSIEIPDGVTRLGYNTFRGCKSLTGITIPESVTGIGYDAISSCDSLSSITIPDSVVNMDNNPMRNNPALTTVNFGSGMTYVPSSCFFWDTSLTGFTIPPTVTVLCGSCFSSCESLSSITIPDTVTSMGGTCFFECRNLSEVTYSTGMTEIPEWTFIGCNLSQFEIPDTIVKIGDIALKGNPLTSLVIPSGVTEFGEMVLDNCSALTSVTFTSTVPPTFGNLPLGPTRYRYPIYVPCKSVDAYKAALPDYAERITCNSEPEPQTAATAITISVPDNLEPGYTGSTSVSTSPTGATTNLSYSSSNNSVATVDNNGNITAVGTGTTNICVTDSISQITECTQLTINNPGPQPVTGTSLLTNIYRTDDLNPGFAPSSAVQLCNESFYSAITEMTIDGVSATPSMTADFSSDAGKGGVRYHTVEYTINTPIVPELSFHKNTHLIHTVISGDCTGIGTEAFWLCEYLGCDSDRGYSGVVLSPNIVLGDAVFGYCTRLKDFEIPTANTVVPESLFYVCSGLTSVTIHSGVTVVSGRSFQQCHSLLSVELPAGLTEIGGSAFIHCRSLTEIRLLGTVPPTIHGSEVFTDTNNCPIYVPAGSVTAYQTAWSQYASRIQPIQ